MIKNISTEKGLVAIERMQGNVVDMEKEEEPVQRESKEGEDSLIAILDMLLDDHKIPFA